MKTNKIITALLMVLCLAMMLTSLSACDLFGGKEGEETTTPAPDNGTNPPPADTVTTLWETDAEGYAVSTIPADTNYAGRNVNTLVYVDSYLFPEETVMDAEGDTIQKDIYKRDRDIELQLGIKFDVTVMQSHMSSNGTDGQQLFNAVLEGQDDYDVVCCYSLFPAQMALAGVLNDLNTLEYPHTEMPWFPSDIQEWAIYDHLFFVANNSSVRNLLSVWSVYANAEMIANKGLEAVEDVVIAGDWTLAKMQEYSRNWASEAQSAEGSVFGVYVHHRTGADAFYTAAGFKGMTRDADGQPQYAFLDATSSELIYDFVDELLVLMNSSECDVGPYSGSNVDRFGNKPITYLKENRAAFYIASMEFYGNLSEDSTYSIIPMPKRNENQEKYLSIRNDAFNVWCVPATTSDPTIGGLVIEAVSYSDYRTIAPKFWENDFIYRYSNDEQGLEMFAIIRDSVSCDFSRVYRYVNVGGGDEEENVGSPYGTMRNCFWQDQTEPKADLTNVWAEAMSEKAESYELRLNLLKQMIKNMFG